MEDHENMANRPGAFQRIRELYRDCGKERTDFWTAYRHFLAVVSEAVDKKWKREESDKPVSRAAKKEKINSGWFAHRIFHGTDRDETTSYSEWYFERFGRKLTELDRWEKMIRDNIDDFQEGRGSNRRNFTLVVLMAIVAAKKFNGETQIKAGSASMQMIDAAACSIVEETFVVIPIYEDHNPQDY
jgi:hypothetical protein